MPDDVTNFIESTKQSGADPRSRPVRLAAERFRNAEKLLPDPIVEFCYLQYFDLQNSIECARSSGYSCWHDDDPVDLPQPLNMRGISDTEIWFGKKGPKLTPRFPNGVDWPVIDATDACNLSIYNPTIDSGINSAAGILMARSAGTKDAARCEIVNAQIIGAFGGSHGGCCLAIIGAELFVVDRSNLRFSGTHGEAFYCSGYNEHCITSPYGPVAGAYSPLLGGPVSNCGGLVTGATHMACDGPGDPTKRRIIDIGSRSYHVIIDDSCYITAKTPGSIESAIILGDPDDDHPEFSGTHNCRIGSIHNEAFAARNFITEFRNASRKTVTQNQVYREAQEQPAVSKR